MLPCTSYCCPQQYSIFPSCYHAHTIECENNLERTERGTRPLTCRMPKLHISLIPFGRVQSKHRNTHLAVSSSRHGNRPSCNHPPHHLAVLSSAPLLRAKVQIIFLSSVQHLSFLLTCRSPRCPQYCTKSSLVPSCTSHCHILTREQSSFVLPCTLSHSPQRSIFR
jgi:hypothetical protein